jgi:hypothetical protein
MLNLLSMREAPSRDTLAEYVRANFQRANGAFQFSCDQDIVRISEVTTLREANSSNATPRMLYDSTTPFFSHVIVYAVPAA